MTIGCPHCLTRYELPGALMGPGGARVTCPRCRQMFLVSPTGQVSAPPSEIRAGEAPEAPVSPRRVAASPPPPEPAAPRASAPVLAPAPEPAEPRLPEAPPPVEVEPIEIARRIVTQLDESHGRDIESAVSRGRVFSEHGLRLVEAFESYRRAVGRNAAAGPFREALYERWGIDLTPHWEERAR